MIVVRLVQWVARKKNLLHIQQMILFIEYIEYRTYDGHQKK